MGHATVFLSPHHVSTNGVALEATFVVQHVLMFCFGMLHWIEVLF